MAHIEVNALSVKLAGTFEAHVFFPEPDVLVTKDTFPVLWMIHEDGTGTFDLLRYTAVMEKIVREKKMFIIAPAVSRSLAVNMAYGTENEDFLGQECIEIFRFMYPISRKKEENYIFGIHSGAYGALKLAMKYTDTFGSCFTVNGEFDIAARCADLFNRDAGFKHQSAESLRAIFGKPEKVRESAEDVYHLAKTSGVKAYLFCGRTLKAYEDHRRLAAIGANIILKDDSNEDDNRAIGGLIEKGLNLCLDR